MFYDLLSIALSFFVFNEGGGGWLPSELKLLLGFSKAASLIPDPIRFDGYIIELETTQRQCLNADKVQSTP